MWGGETCLLLQLVKEGNRLRMASYKELEGRPQREQKMRDVAQGMALQKELMVRTTAPSRVALGHPSHRSRVNPGQRFNEGLDRGAPVEWKSAWWAFVEFIRAVTWSSIETI